MADATILVIDDHALFRAGIAAMLSTAFDGAVLLDCASLDDALARVACAPTVVLLDIQLPGLNGLEGMGLIRQRWPSARTVVVSAYDQTEMVDAAFARGAAAFLSKTDRPERMMTVLRALMEEPAIARSGRDAVRPLLTARQTEVLDFAGQGLSNKMIGRRLGLSEHTVRGHVQALLAALGVARRAEAVFKARQLGLIR